MSVDFSPHAQWICTPTGLVATGQRPSLPLPRWRARTPIPQPGWRGVRERVRPAPAVPSRTERDRIDPQQSLNVGSEGCPRMKAHQILQAGRATGHPWQRHGSSPAQCKSSEACASRPRCGAPAARRRRRVETSRPAGAPISKPACGAYCSTAVVRRTTSGIGRIPWRAGRSHPRCLSGGDGVRPLTHHHHPCSSSKIERRPG